MSRQSAMDTYLAQLAGQMRESARNLPDPNVFSEFDEESLPEELKPFAEVERYLHGKAKKLAEITSIDTNTLPPAEKLAEVQISFLYSEMKQLLNAYCFHADFPKGLPETIKYRLLRQKWDEEVVYTGEGITVFEFCDYEPDRCPFPEAYCGCKEFGEEDVE